MFRQLIGPALLAGLVSVGVVSAGGAAAAQPPRASRMNGNPGPFPTKPHVPPKPHFPPVVGFPTVGYGPFPAYPVYRPVFVPVYPTYPVYPGFFGFKPSFPGRGYGYPVGWFGY